MAVNVPFTTALTALTGVKYPIVQTGMGWVSDSRLVAATAEAGGLGLIASSTMSLQELEIAILEVKERTDKPFGVNLRADASDAAARADLLISHGVKVAGFALAPRRDLITKLKDHGVVVMPSVGAPRHAEKVAAWGADMVMIQGGEGGGHTGAVPTSLLLPAVLDAVDIPVIAAGGYFDGRGLASALAYGAAGIGMGTRFLLTSDSSVPEDVKKAYLDFGLDGTVVTTKIDGMPIRLLRTEFVENLATQGKRPSVTAWMRNVLELRRETGASWGKFIREGVAMNRGGGRSLYQTAIAANTPMMMKAGLIDGDTSAGILSAGQVVGSIHDLPSCAELIERIMNQASERITALTTLPTNT